MPAQQTCHAYSIPSNVRGLLCNLRWQCKSTVWGGANHTAFSADRMSSMDGAALTRVWQRLPSHRPEYCRKFQLYILIYRQITQSINKQNVYHSSFPKIRQQLHAHLAAPLDDDEFTTGVGATLLYTEVRRSLGKMSRHSG